MKHLDWSSYPKGKFGQIPSRNVTVSDAYFVKVPLGFCGILHREYSRVKRASREICYTAISEIYMRNGDGWRGKTSEISSC